MKTSQHRRRSGSASRKSAPRQPDLSNADAEVRALAAAIGDVILLFDADGRYLKATSTNSGLLYRPAEELIGHTLHEVFPAPQADTFLGIIRRTLDTRQASTLEYNLRLGESEYWFSATVAPMLDDQVVWVARDITERRQVENISEVQRSILELIATGAPLPTVLMTLTQLMEARSSGLLCSVMVMDADGQHLRHGAAPSLPHAYNRAIDGITIGPKVGSWGTAAFRGELVIVSDIKHDLLWDDDRDLALEHGLRACWSRPILSTSGRVLGTFSMYDREPRSPGPYELSLIDIAASLASIAIERQRAEDALRQAEAAERERVAELEAVRRVSLSLTSNLRFPAVLDDVLSAVFRLMSGAKNVHVFLYDADNDHMSFGAAVRADGRKVDPWPAPRPKGLTYTVARSGRTVVVDDMNKHPLYAEAHNHWGGAIVGLPLKIGRRVVGVMNAAYAAPRTFPESELRRLELLADQAAIAIENARLFQAERVAREQAEALREVAGAVNSSLDRTQVLRSILEQLLRVVEYDSASVMLVTQNSVTLVASRGFRSEAQEQFGSLQIATMEHIKETITQRHPVIIEDTASDKRWQPAIDPDGNYIRCWLGVPLVAQDQVIGLLNLDKEQPGYYTEHHAKLAAAFANQAAVAIENARLYEALSQETQRLELLNQVSRDLSARLDPEQVYAAIHRATEQLMPSDAFAIALLVESGREIEMSYLMDRGERARIRNVPLDRGLSGHVISTGKPLRIENVEQFGHIDVVHFGGGDHVRSAVAVPMRLGDKVIGVLTAQSYEAYAYTAVEEQTLGTLAYQAAIAIENARLYAETQRQLRDQTLLYECGQALALVRDTRAALTTVAERIVARFNATSMYYLSYDEGGGVIRVEYEYWVPQATERERQSAAGQRLDFTHHPRTLASLQMRLPQVTSRSDSDLSPQEREMLAAYDGQSVITVPLVLHDAVIGCFEIWNSQDEYGYSAKDKQLLMALATQAAIAVENAQLYAETKQQALELSTLLGAAKAVSSTLNLEEVVRLIAQQMVKATNAVGCTISQWDKEVDAVITWVAWRQRQLRYIDQPGFVYRLDEFPATREVLEKRQTRLVVAADPASDPAEAGLMKQVGIYCLLMLPLAIGDRVIGLVEVYEDSPERVFVADEIGLFQAMANQAAVAIVNAQLFEALADEKERLELLYDLSQNLANTLDPYDVAARAIEQICASFDAFQGAIFIAQPDSDRLTVIALTNSSPDRIEELNRQMDLQIGQGVAGWVAEHQRATIVDAVAQDPRWFVVPGMDDRVRSVISAPLIAGNTLVGVISLYSDQPGAFRKEQLPLLNAATTPMAAALQNARLFDETRRHADEVTTASSILHALNSSPDVTQSFPDIVTGLRAMTDCERVSLALLDESRQQVIIVALDQPRPELNRGARFPLTATAAAEDVLAGRPHLTPNLADEISFPMEKRLYDAGHRSRINLPLRVGRQVTGALNLTWSRPAAFGRINLPLVSQMADALALAIEKTRFFEESRQRDAILESLAYGSQRLLMPGNLGEMLLDTLAHLGQVISVSRVYVFENHRGANGTLFTSQRYEWCAPGYLPQIDNPDWQNMPFAGASKRWEQILSSGQPLYGLVRDFPPDERALLELQDIRSVAVVPISSGGDWWGFLGFDDCAQERVWASAEIETLKSAAAMLGAAFARQRSEAAEREQRALAEALRDTALALNSTLDFDEVLDRILDNVGRVTPHDAAVVMLVENVRYEAYVVRARGYRERSPDAGVYNLSIPLDKAANLIAMKTDGLPFIINDVTTYPDWIDFPPSRWVRSYLGAPIRVRGQVIGFINLDSATPGFFTQTHADHLQAFANEASVAIDNARLFAAAEKHVRSATLLNEITHAALEASNFTESLQTLADRLGQLVDADGCYITLWDEVRQQPIPVVAYGARREQYPSSASRSLPGEKTLTASVLESGRALIVEDVFNSPFISKRLVQAYESFPLHSMIGLPLIVGDKKLGAVLISYDNPHQFTPEEIALSEQAAGQVALAIFKGKLLEAEREQRVMAEALRDTAAALTSTLNFDDVLDRILANVGRVVPHDSASIMLADDPSWGIDAQNGTVRIVRCRGFAERELEEWALSLRFPVATSPKMRQMLASQQAIIIADTQTDPNWIVFEEEDWIRSYIGAPIRVKGRTIGFLNLDSTIPEFFTAIHAERLQVFADQAAVAIENAHLYDSIRQNAEELGLLYRASAQLINPGADVATLAAQIASVVTKEFKSAHCAVWLMDETGRLVKRLVEAGELRVSCPPLLPVHGAGLIAAAARNGEVVYVPDVRDDPRYLDGNSTTRSELAVPLKAGGPVIGVLNLESPALDAFDERTRRIVVAFAERAGLALENTQLLARLDLARRAAEEASQLKSEFLANTSHELRTPLTGIIGSLSMVLDGLCDQPEEEREFIQIAYAASEHLLAIINDVLDIAKIEAGRLEVELQALELAAVFGELRLLARVPAEEKKLHLELRPPKDRNLKVWADPDMLRQIMVNLVGNAIKFTEEGSVIVRADGEGGWAQITVRDTGIGIPPDKQAKLFHPFVQADGSMTRKYGGTGLGLSISRRLAERMGGTLTLYSAGEGQGTTFTLRLPLYENVESAESNGGGRANP